MQVTGQEVPRNPSWSLPLQVYVVIHFLLVLWIYHELFENKMVRIRHINCKCQQRQRTEDLCIQTSSEDLLPRSETP